MSANSRQVGGDHYAGDIQHWDFVAAQKLDYFQGQITKYVARHKKKNGLQDLEKALHFFQKYLEVEYGIRLELDAKPIEQPRKDGCKVTGVVFEGDADKRYVNQGDD